MFGVQLHTLVTHFPIALTVAAFAYDASAFYYRNPGRYGIGSGLIRFAAVTAVLSAGTGFSLAGVSGLGSGGSVTGHAGFGALTAIILVALVFVRYSAEERLGAAEGSFSGLLLAVEGLAVILVAATAIIGHSM